MAKLTNINIEIKKNVNFLQIHQNPAKITEKKSNKHLITF